MLDAFMKGSGITDAQAAAVADLVRNLEAREGVEAGERAREIAWRKLLDDPKPQGSSARRLSQALEQAGLPPPLALVADAQWLKTFLFGATRTEQTARLSVAAPEAFWRSLIAAMRAASPGEREQMFRIVQNLEPHPSVDREWADLLRLPPFDVPSQVFIPQGIWEAMARCADPALPDLVRRFTAGVQWQGHNVGAALKALSSYPEGPRMALVEELLVGAPSHWQSTLLARLSEAGAAGREVVIRYAKNSEHPWSFQALAQLKDEEDGPVIAEICADLERRSSLAGVGTNYRTGVIAAAKRLHLREAFPYLLREYKSGLSESAGKAMSEIQAYHEQMARFDTWAHGEAGGGVSALADLLRDADPEIRRAAALSLGALGTREALPALVRLAKEDPEPRVREAALKAVERMAR
jgi:hypothetical protein